MVDNKDNCRRFLNKAKEVLLMENWIKKVYGKQVLLKVMYFNIFFVSHALW